MVIQHDLLLISGRALSQCDGLEYQQGKHSLLLSLGISLLQPEMTFPDSGQLVGRLWDILWKEWNLWDIAGILSQ